jgi:DNA-binding transcriptional LysR family regulator
VVAAVRDRDADVGVAVFDDIPRQLSKIELVSYGQMLAIPEGHDLAQRRRLRLADLDRLPLITPRRGRPQRDALERIMRSGGKALQVSVEAEGGELMLHFVSLGLGCAVVNGSVPARTGVVLRPISDLPKITYSAVIRDAKEANTRIAEVLRVLMRSMRAQDRPAAQGG